VSVTRKTWTEDSVDDSLLEVPFDQGLSRLSAAERDALLEAAEHKTFRRGEAILSEGRRNDSIYVVAEGTVRIERTVGVVAQYGTVGARPGPRHRTVQIAHLGRGSIFGEMSFLEDAGASANVIANEGVGAFRISLDVIEQFCQWDPSFAGRLYQSLAMTLANRLRATNRRLAD